jgi:hypothetical protein
MVEYQPDRLDWLHQQLARGWCLKPPALERAATVHTEDLMSVFDFVLTHEQGYQVITVSDSHELREFLTKYDVGVVAV